MPDPGPRLWVSQADADLHASKLVYDVADHRTYCQSISKHQQTVEKSIKAIAAALRDADITKVKDKHYYDHNVKKLIEALLHAPMSKDHREVLGQIMGLLNNWQRLQIDELSALAPKKPSPGELHRRNTEYPYEKAPGDWTAPALLESFTPHDVVRFLQLACRICQGTKNIVKALRRA